MNRGGSTLARLSRLSAAHHAKQARRVALETDGRGTALEREALALLELLPDAERAAVEARGARGVAELLEASWELNTTGEDLAHLARRAYRLAFEGGDA